MYISITERSGTGFTGLTITHRDQTLHWTVKFFTKVKLVDPDDVFAGVNGYMATLREDTQDRLFALYQDMHETITETLDSDDMVFPLRDRIAALYREIDMDDLHHWVMMNYPLFVPPDIPDTANAEDQHNNRDQTFVKADYYDLAVFSIGVRFIIPVWGAYIMQNGGSKNSDVYKEVDAISLLDGNPIFRWPFTPSTEGGRPVYEKLLRYIEIRASQKSMTLADLKAGLGEADLAPRLLATVILRRLTIAPLTANKVLGGGKNLVANIYHYVDQHLSNNDKRSGAVAPKRNPSEGHDPEDKTSVAEEYRIRQKVTDGDIVAYDELDARRPLLIAHKVDPTLPPALLETCLTALPNLENTIANDHQFTLAQWALAKGFPPQAFDDIMLKSVNNLLLAAQALYWHWGYTDLALLLTVAPVSLSTDDHPGISPLVRPNTRFKPEVQEDFMTMFPHYFPQSGKDAKPIKGNVAFIGAGILLQEIFQSSWHYLGCQELLEVAQPDHTSRSVIVSNTIRQSIYEAVKTITSLNQ